MTALLLDGNSIMHRSYHASRGDVTYRGDGLPVSATGDFIKIVWYLLRSRMKDEGVIYGSWFFDGPGKNWRHDNFPQYKANRPERPADQEPQFKMMRYATPMFGIPVTMIDNTEADDLIATYTRMYVEAGIPVVIVTADKDLMQLVSDENNVRIYNHLKQFQPFENDPTIKRRGVMFTEATVEHTYGVPPRKIGDWLALMGDASDNIPGVAGVGEKTAASLLSMFGGIEQVISNASMISKPKIRDNLIASIDQIRDAREIVSLDEFTKVPGDLPFIEDISYPSIISFVRALGLIADVNLYADECGLEPNKVKDNLRHAAFLDDMARMIPKS